MIYRIYPSKDTWITDLVPDFIPVVPVTGSNFGASEILEVFKKNPLSSGSAGWAGSSSLGHILLQFDLSGWSQLTASLQAPSIAMWRLVLHDARHAETLPSSYDLEALALSQSWDEGSGLDEDTFRDLGQANWIQGRSNVYWTVPGGDVLADDISSFHLDTGHEDVDFDVGTIVNDWLAGTFPNNGLLVRVSSSLETSNSDFYVKKFHGRQTNFLDRRPYLEARWDDSFRDDRNNFVFDAPSVLFLYNEVRGQLTNLAGVSAGPNCLDVRINDLSGTVLATSASWTGHVGIYSASFILPSGSYSGSVFHDVWTSGSRLFVSGTFYPSSPAPQSVLAPGRYVASIPNLKNEYTVDENPELRVFVSSFDYNPVVVLTGSQPVPAGFIISRGYYRIDNDRTKEQVIPFGTASYYGGTDWTRLSYDGNGNYFSFFMSSLSPGNVYRIVFLFDQDGQRQIVDGGFKFRVT